MNNKNFKIPVLLAVFVALVTVLGACAPGLTPGAVPGEISSGPQVVEEAPVLTPEVGLSEETAAVAEATTVNLDEELSGLSAPVEGQIEEHMVTEFPSATILGLDEELSGLSASVEGQIEEHMVTEFSAGTVSMENEFLSAFGLAPVVEQLEEDIVLEFGPEEGLVEGDIALEFAPMEGLREDIVVAEVTIVDELIEEVAPIIPAIQLGSADLMNGDLAVKTQISGFILDPDSIGKAKVEGRGHWHLYIDGKLAGFSGTDSITIGKDKLAEFGGGTHDIKIELHNNDHSLVSEAAWAGTKLDFGVSMMAPDIKKDTMMGGYSY